MSLSGQGQERWIHFSNVCRVQGFTGLGQAVGRACVRSGSAAASVLPTKANRGGMCNSLLALLKDSLEPNTHLCLDLGRRRKTGWQANILSKAEISQCLLPSVWRIFGLGFTTCCLFLWWTAYLLQNKITRIYFHSQSSSLDWTLLSSSVPVDWENRDKTFSQIHCFSVAILCCMQLKVFKYFFRKCEDQYTLL